MCFEENRKLEKEIEEIIVTYTKIVEDKCKNQNELDQSVMELREKKDEVMEKKMHVLAKENEALKLKLEALAEQLNEKNAEGARKMEDEGWYARANLLAPSSITVESIEFSSPENLRAVLISCVVDSQTIYEYSDSFDGGESLVNDEIGTGRVSYEMQKQDDVWQVTDWESQKYWEGMTSCAG
jgi:hypothetical protein